MPLAPDPHDEADAGVAPDPIAAPAPANAPANDGAPADETEPGARPRAPRSPAYNRDPVAAPADPPRPFRSGLGTGAAPGATARAERLAAGVADAADRASAG